MDLICHDIDCTLCDARAERRICADCGAKGNVTDCGHFAQPRPIAGSQYDGKAVCGTCEARRERVAELRAARTRKGSGYAPPRRHCFTAACEGRLWDVDTQGRGADSLVVADSADEALADVALDEEPELASTHDGGAVEWARTQRWSAARFGA